MNPAFEKGLPIRWDSWRLLNPGEQSIRINQLMVEQGTHVRPIFFPACS
jgi:hypothetical protein